MSEKIHRKVKVVTSGEYGSEGGQGGEMVFFLLCTFIPLCIAGFYLCLLFFFLFTRNTFYLFIL